eukprot:g30705.t1
MVRASAPPPTTLHEAALRGDLKYINEMLDQLEEPSDINKWDEKKIAPLGYAVACGHLEAVKLLLKRGADITLQDGQENTFLHYAAGYGHLAVLEECCHLLHSFGKASEPQRVLVHSLKKS